MSSSSQDPDEETASSSEALDEVNRHIKKVFEILESEKEKLSKEMEAFDAVAKKLKSVHFSKMLKLNVGGKVFDTSLETMNSDPGMYLLTASITKRFTIKIRCQLTARRLISIVFSVKYRFSLLFPN